MREFIRSKTNRRKALFPKNFQLPDFLQMDNELSFRGSNKYPGSLGLLLKVALSCGVTPVFIPAAEPWRNGVIEKFNHNANHRLGVSGTGLQIR